jgi:integrase
MAGSYRVVARVGDRKTGPAPKEKRFPAGTALREMRSWQEDTRAELRRSNMRPARGMLAGDVPTYLTRMDGQLEHPSDRKHEIEAWLPSFGHRRRHTIKDHEIEEQVREWQNKGVAASTIRHRLSALSKLYKELDGKRAHNPVATVERPSEPKPGANALPLEQVVRVLDALAARVKQNNRGWKTLARIRVIAATGLRHSQVMRLQPADIWLDNDPPIVHVNHAGKGGKPTRSRSPRTVWRHFVSSSRRKPFGSSRSPASTSLGSSPVRMPA